MPERERGQATPLVLVVVLFVALTLAGVGRLGIAASQRASAQATADAVALAGASHDEAAATEVATANGASLQRFVMEGETVLVEVRRDGVVAHARARWDLGPIP
jgi:hypothetical protein